MISFLRNKKDRTKSSGEILAFLENSKGLKKRNRDISNFDMQKKNDLQGKERINLIKAIAIDISIALSAFIVSTGICYLLQYFKVDVLNYIIIYILGILLTAVFTKGYIYSALLSVVSVFGYNFFFTVPKYTFYKL